MTEPSSLGRYRVESLLGAGGMGRVYLAEDVTLGRHVALKVLSTEPSSDPNRSLRFLQEARLAAAISHPNIAQIFEVGEVDGHHFIAMEYVEGETLAAKLLPGPLAGAEVVDIAMQTFDALDEAHGRGIVHRDLKPANIALTPRGRVKVLDFGLATIAASHQAISTATTQVTTSPGVIVGTISYMSPEQALGRAIDARSDLFSAGVVLFELLTGRRPFDGPTVTETLDRIVNAPPTAMGELRSGSALELERIVRKTLEKEPSRRYQSARDVLIDLANLKRDSDAPPRVATPARQRTTGKSLQSVAVLPLRVTSADAAVDYLADGITEGLIDALAQFPKFKVMARSTVFRYKNADVDPREIGRSLGVRAVLVGRLQSIGERLLLRAELVDTTDGSHVWGGQFQRQSADVLSLQEALVEEIVGQLRLRLTRDDRKRLRRRSTGNAAAYEIYLRGRFQLTTRTRAGFTRAIDCFEQAVALDPEFALAFTGLADCYTLLATAAYGEAPADAIARARRAAEQAIRLDDHLAEAHVALGFVRFRIDWDWPAAEASLKRACDLSPGYAPAHHSYALFLAAMDRREDALREIRTAHELDPLSLIIGTAYGRVLHFSRQFDLAIAQFKRTLDMDRQFVQAHFDLAMSYAAAGRHAEAITELEPYLEPSDRRSVMLAVLAFCCAKGGRRDDARRILEELQARHADGRASGADLGYVQTALGDIDDAVTSFERAHAARVGLVVFLKVEPMVDALRSHPRFQALLTGLRFSEQQSTERAKE